jgi:hypothetical protein
MRHFACILLLLATQTACFHIQTLRTSAYVSSTRGEAKICLSSPTRKGFAQTRSAWRLLLAAQHGMHKEDASEETAPLLVIHNHTVGSFPTMGGYCLLTSQIDAYMHLSTQYIHKYLHTHAFTHVHTYIHVHIKRNNNMNIRTYKYIYTYKQFILHAYIHNIYTSY